jgi:glycerate-2-kinase
MPPDRELLRSAFDVAIAAARPRTEWFRGFVPSLGRTIVIGAGKAAASMAAAFEETELPISAALVITRYGHSVPTRSIEVAEASHPVPDAAGVAATRRILTMVYGLGEEDTVVALISGGGSALLCLPAPGVTLDEKIDITTQLLRSGADIQEINTVRRALSAVKDGRLLQACAPARVVTYLISDVAGDDPAVIASGPTVPRQTRLPGHDASDVLKKYGIKPPLGLSGPPVEETPSYPPHEEHLVASSRISLEAAAQFARTQDCDAKILSDAVTGDAREVARDHAQLVGGIPPRDRPLLLLSGGETTVAVRGNGQGGRNVEYLAALALELDGRPGVYAIAGDTDGIDGIGNRAGAIIDPTTLRRAGPRLAQALANNDCHTLFENLDDSIVTGPTFTNVNDFRAILVRRSKA